MKIAIINTPGMNIYGGAEMMCRDLCNSFIKYGHDAIVFDLPRDRSPMRHIISNAFLATQMDFSFADMIVPMCYAALYVPHDNCVPWLIRQDSSVYEWFDRSELGGLEQFGAEGRFIRSVVNRADTAMIAKAKRLYTISPAVTDYLYEFCGLKAKTLTIPFEPKNEFECNEYGDYIFYPGRVVSSKRPLLAVNAMRYVESEVKLILAGDSDDQQYIDNVKQTIKEYNLQNRVKYIDRYISEKEKTELFSKCLGSLYLGYNESYWSLVATEAAFCCKPIIAPSDTGATSYLVIDGETGYRPDSSPQAMAEAMDKLYLNRNKTEQMGKAIRERISMLIPTWETVVKVLTGEMEWTWCL